MNIKKFTNKKEFDEYYEENQLMGDTIWWSFIEEPIHYPCILVWEKIDYGEEKTIDGKFIYVEDLI